MNIPNRLTVLRILIAPVFMVFFVIDNFYTRLTSLILFTIAALTDLADGYYARKFGIITGFGKFMDPLADKILVSTALISFTSLGYVSPLPVMLIIGREFFITGLRLLGAYRGLVIPPSWWAKVKTFLQLTVVGFIVFYVNLMAILQHYQSPLVQHLTFDTHYYFSVIIWVTAAVTVWTGIDYILKYFYLIRTVLK